MPEAAGFEHDVVETPGLRTHVASIGEGDAVLMLHGFPQHWWQWSRIAPAVAAAGHRVHCPDLRGAGWTVADDPGIGRETRLHDVLALMDALEIDRAHVVSHDMGTVTAWQLAYDHADRVRSSVQLAVPPPYLRFDPRLAPGFRHFPRFIWHRRGGSLDWVFTPAYLAHPLSDEVMAAHLAPLAIPEVESAVRPLTRDFVLPEAVRMMRGVYRRRRLTVPTLVIFGRRDWPWSEQLLRRACADPDHRFADHVELSFIDDAAHYVTDDAPDEVADLIVDWLVRAPA